MIWSLQLYNVYTISKDANGNSMASAGSTLFDSSVKSELIKSLGGWCRLTFLQ